MIGLWLGSIQGRETILNDTAIKPDKTRREQLRQNKIELKHCPRVGNQM